MFNWLKKKNKDIEVLACVDGVLIPLKDVKDEAFRSGAIGRGVGIKPTSSKIYSPLDGTIKMIFPTNHAVGMETEEGLEFIIHIGIDTVKLKGEGFKKIAEEGQVVKAGDLLIEVDFQLLEEKGYCTDVLMILTTDSKKADFHEIEAYGQKVIGKEDTIFTCSIKNK